ncbi:MAG: PrsW family intramembrane metalloprotease [Nocardioidaceae bacterium]
MSGVGGFDQGQFSGHPYGQYPPLQPAFDRPRRRGGVGFTIFVSAAMLLGAGVMALVLLGSGAGGGLVIATVLAALPVAPLVACFMWLDRYEPEPRGLILSALGWGALVATAAALVLQTANQFAFATPEPVEASIVAPITEEAAKGLFVVLLLLSRRHEIDGILDGIVYAGMVGIGFAFTENILYLAAAYMGGEDLGPGGIGAVTGTFVVRGIFSPFAHPFFTSAVGIGVGFAVVTRSRFWRVFAPILGYVVAVLGHALWNGTAFLAGGRLFLLGYVFVMVPAFFLLAAFAIWARKREGEMLVRALTDCADRGFLGHWEVPWLARLPGRRASRAWAKANGGPQALEAMSAYQQQATELGFLHDRYLRGTAPADFAQRGQAMVNDLTALRPYVLFPQPPVGNYIAGPRSEGGR